MVLCHLQIKFTDLVLGISAGDVKSVSRAEILKLLGCGVHDLCCELDRDPVEVGWHLEVNSKLFVVIEFDVVESLGDRSVIDIVISCEHDLGVLQGARLGFSSIDIELGSHNDECIRAEQDRLLIYVEFTVEGVGLGLVQEVSKLVEGSIFHDDLLGLL